MRGPRSCRARWAGPAGRVTTECRSRRRISSGWARRCRSPFRSGRIARRARSCIRIRSSWAGASGWRFCTTPTATATGGTSRSRTVSVPSIRRPEARSSTTRGAARPVFTRTAARLRDSEWTRVCSSCRRGAAFPWKGTAPSCVSSPVIAGRKPGSGRSSASPTASPFRTSGASDSSSPASSSTAPSSSSSTTWVSSSATRTSTWEVRFPSSSATPLRCWAPRPPAGRPPSGPRGSCFRTGS